MENFITVYAIVFGVLQTVLFFIMSEMDFLNNI